MSKAVLISIRPEWCEKILNGQKTIELRKTAPKLAAPFKCYIYCTAAKGKEEYHVPITKESLSLAGCQRTVGNKRVIAEFICDKIITVCVKYSDPENRLSQREFPFTGLTDRQVMDYLGNGVDGYGWHISDLKIYAQPKEIEEFTQCHRCEYYAYCRDRELSCDGTYVLHRPPQSWCYVEEVG